MTPGTIESLRSYSSSRDPQWRKAYLALGANVGDKLATMEQACHLLSQHSTIRMLRTSLLYPTKPMYVEDQQWFYNAACEIETSLSPIDLLDVLQGIENKLGRVKLIDKGPRNIDLDILLYEGQEVSTDRLTVPHALMHEREFVLRPLADIIPEQTIPGKDQTRSIASYLSSLPPSDPPMAPIVPFGRSQSLRPDDPQRRTKVMSILNVTPDSFSDGGEHFSSATSADSTLSKAISNLNAAVSNLNPDTRSSSALRHLNIVESNPYLTHLYSTISSHINQGATILDVGGQSSRPGAPSITAEEEWTRILPALLLQQLFFPNLATSIDTYRSAVADNALSLSNDYIINDISAGLLDPQMLSTIARHRATVILMHMRGDPGTMSNKANTTYPDGVVKGVATELLQRISEAEKAGIPKWRIVLDPGIGFAKTARQNIELLRGMDELRNWPGLRGMPWLVGSSRKKFVGGILGRDDARRKVEWDGVSGEAVGEMKDEKVTVRGADGRDWGTAATVVEAVRGGADIVRTHEVGGMRDVVAVADAIYRGS